MKKVIMILLSVTMALLFTACGAKSAATESIAPSQKPAQVTTQPTEAPASVSPSESAEIGGVQIPNPFADCKTLEEAEKLAGFNMSVTDKIPEGYKIEAITAIKNDMIQIIYKNGDNQLCIRKGAGSDDISGDYNEYKETSSVSAGGSEVTMKGNDGKVSVATWVNGKYTYSITATTGLDKTVVSDIATGIK